MNKWTCYFINEGSVKSTSTVPLKVCTGKCHDIKNSFQIKVRENYKYEMLSNKTKCKNGKNMKPLHSFFVS